MRKFKKKIFSWKKCSRNKFIFLKQLTDILQTFVCSFVMFLFLEPTYDATIKLYGVDFDVSLGLGYFEIIIFGTWTKSHEISFNSAWMVLPKFSPTGKKEMLIDMELFAGYVGCDFIWGFVCLTEISMNLFQIFWTIRALAAITLKLSFLLSLPIRS